MAVKKKYIVLVGAFFSMMTGMGFRVGMQGPLTEELTVRFNATTVETNWPSTVAEGTHFMLCEYPRFMVTI